MKQFKVVIFQETGILAVLFGQGKMDPIKFTDFLNRHAEEGWDVVTVEKENRRRFLFFKVEAMVVVLRK